MGFDHSYGSLNGAVDPWNHKYRKGPYEDTWHRDGKRIDEEGNATELVSKEVLGWINAGRSRPGLFTYLFMRFIFRWMRPKNTN
ncbi:MAG: hypothetical protein EBQ87_02585 [Planctomycetes bacterium]|nr:hypothetical protein [Planctomycetota bacterium]